VSARGPDDPRPRRIDVLGCPFDAVSFAETVAEIRDQGKCVIFSTHIMSEAEKLCDRIAIVHRGRILACDTLAGLRDATGLHYLEDIFLLYVRGPA